MLRDAIGQGYVIRETWGWMHYTIYVGFIGLLIGTSIVFLNSDLRDLAGLFGLPLYFYFGDFYLFFKAAMDSFFVIFISGRNRGLRGLAGLHKPALLDLLVHLGHGPDLALGHGLDSLCPLRA
jgi:hypothetical protein